MDIKKKNLDLKAIVIIWAVLTGVTFSIYFIPDIERSDIDNLAFAFIIITEFIFFGGLALVARSRQKEDIFSAAGLVVLFPIYFVMNLIINIANMAIMENIHIVILVQIIIHAALIIIAVAILFFAVKIERSNKETKEKLKSGELNKAKRGGF